jgi:hypothetical protein
VEIDGVLQGTTPFEKDFPGGYFHKTKTSMGSRLEHPMVARISLMGYATKEIQMTDGPMNWISFKGRNHEEYWLLKSDHFNADLRPISEVFVRHSDGGRAFRAIREPDATRIWRRGDYFGSRGRRNLRGRQICRKCAGKLKLAAGSHIMVLKASGFAEWKRTLEILKDSQVTLKPVLDHAP